MKILTNMFILVCINIACSTTIHITESEEVILSDRVPVDINDVKTIKYDDKVSGLYEVVGKIFIERFDITESVSEDKLIKLMKKEASELGANAIIGIQSSLDGIKRYGQTENRRWASGLLVDVKGKSNKPVKPGFIICIPRIINHIKDIDDRLKKTINDRILEVLRYNLEYKGYYTVIVDESVTTDNMAYKTYYLNSKLRYVNPSHCLIIEVLDLSVTNAGIYVGAKLNVSGYLMSVENGTLEWHKNVDGHFSNAGFDALEGDHNWRVIYPTIIGLLGSLESKCSIIK